VRRRLASAAAALSFVILGVLLIWQGSFKIEYSPSGLSETVVLWAVSTLIFILTVTLAFMLFRAAVKVYIDRQRNREGSRIRSKLLVGALVLTLAPTLFYVIFSVYVLNRHLDAWFSRPPRTIQADLRALEESYKQEKQARVEAETQWLSLLPQTVSAAEGNRPDDAFFRDLCRKRGIRQLTFTPDRGDPVVLHQEPVSLQDALFRAQAVVSAGSERLGVLNSASDLDNPSTRDLAAKEDAIRQYTEVESSRRKIYQDTYFRLICLITVFVLFFASWSAQLLSRQISGPISALLGAAHQVRRGNLAYRVQVNAMDELATLVRAFNEMTDDLEGNARELESRRRFTEAILESIPTGVISISSTEQIERVNRALNGIFSPEIVATAGTLADLFTPDELPDIRYLLRHARRMGTAATQMEIQRNAAVLHLAVTVASLDENRGFVLVIEDTSDLMRAQRTSAWQEVARRIAHEIKNPLTPISLCADRIARQLARLPEGSNVRAILSECTQIIQGEVQTVKTLVDEFSQFSRFPTAQPIPANLNEIVDNALSAFTGRLENTQITLDLDPDLPPVLADKEQIKRVIVNLVDNAAEAMLQSTVRELHVSTSQVSPYTVELIVSDTGPGVSAIDKEKLFLPYFSTKDRGTGLGLAIVNRIVKDHGGHVRVEENRPIGTRFVVELNTVPSTEPEIVESLPAPINL
jgi:two-component system, NtrC family, nitrogen regulation sensor histidine kinase NtrY